MKCCGNDQETLKSVGKILGSSDFIISPIIGLRRSPQTNSCNGNGVALVDEDIMCKAMKRATTRNLDSNMELKMVANTTILVQYRNSLILTLLKEVRTRLLILTVSCSHT